MHKFIFILVIGALVAGGFFYLASGSPEAAAAGDSSWRDSLASVLALARKRAVRTGSAIYFADLDKDGYGDSRSVVGVEAGGVTNALDCNDQNAQLTLWQNRMLPDCNANGIADDDLPTKSCVGNAEKRSVQSEYVENGQVVIGVRLVTLYKDARNAYWVSSQDAQRDSRGKIRLDNGRGACPRM